MSSSERPQAGEQAGPDSSSSTSSAAPAATNQAETALPRHAAITRNLHTLSNYKSWTEQVRDAWESGSLAASAPEEPLTEAAAKK